MNKFLKDISTDADDEVSSNQRLRLSFDAVEREVPELWETVVLFRSRVKELRSHFEFDARKRLRGHIISTIAGFAFGTFAMVEAVTHSLTPGEENGNLALLAASAVVALAISAIGAVGYNKRYAAIFSAQWAMKALEANIDQAVFELASSVARHGEGEKTSLNEFERALLLKRMDTWRQDFNTILVSFGVTYGSAFSLISAPNFRLTAGK